MIMISLSHFKILFQMLFLVRVTSTEYNWVSLAEGRHLDANLALKEEILAKTTPPNGRPGRYRADDKLLAFLKGL